MAFLDTNFPRNVAAGVSGGPERRVDIVPLTNGFEERNERWANSRRTFDAGLGIRSANDLHKVLTLFEEAGGPLHSFRFRDHADFKSCPPDNTPSATDQTIGTGDGSAVTFQLVRVYGTLSPYTRTITHPVAGSVLVALDGVLQGAGWTVNQTTGVVTFTTAPAAGVAITAGYLFDVPVRFNTQRLAVDMAYFNGEDDGVGSIPEIPLIEVRT